MGSVTTLHYRADVATFGGNDLSRPHRGLCGVFGYIVPDTSYEHFLISQPEDVTCQLCKDKLNKLDSPLVKHIAQMQRRNNGELLGVEDEVLDIYVYPIFLLCNPTKIHSHVKLDIPPEGPHTKDLPAMLVRDAAGEQFSFLAEYSNNPLAVSQALGWATCGVCKKELSARYPVSFIKLEEEAGAWDL